MYYMGQDTLKFFQNIWFPWRDNLASIAHVSNSNGYSTIITDASLAVGDTPVHIMASFQADNLV